MSERSKRIAIFHPFLSFRGGAERKILLLAKSLIASGHMVYIITFSLERSKTFEELLPDQKHIHIIKKNMYGVYKLTQFIKFDKLYVSNYPANIFAMFIKAREKIWICNEVALLRSKEMGWNVPKWKTIFDKLSVKQFEKCIVNSNHTAQSFQRYYNINPITVYSGFDTNALRNLKPEPMLYLEGAKFVFVISRISHDKNIKFLEKIMDYLERGITNLKVVVAGVGSDQEYLECLSQKYRNLIYIGSVTEGQKKWLYANCQVFAFLPRNEPLGVTVVEALLYGARIVAFNSGGPREVLKPFPLYLAEDAQVYLQKLLSTFKYEANDTLEWVEDNFSLQSMLDGMDA